MNLLRGTHPKLNMLNFFSGDVGNAVGPFLATYLIATANWEETRIGWVLLVINLATVLTQTPAGWLIDHTRRKRLLIAGAAASIGLAMRDPPGPGLCDPDGRVGADRGRCRGHHSRDCVGHARHREA
jgi:MFS family permease